jgi:hypothetical protein
MKKFFGYGSIIALLFLVLGIWTENDDLFLLLSGGTGLACFLISALLSGALNDGDRIRANYWTESQQDLSQRIASMSRWFAFGIPNILVALLFLFLR